MKGVLSHLAFLFALSAAAPGVATAQQSTSPANSLPATYVSAADIQANLNAAPNSATNRLPNIRVVDAGGYNLAVGAIHRRHPATLVTGGTMVNEKTRPPDSIPVRLEDGPGASGTSIQGGVSRRVKAGDVVVIPAGVPHWFSAIEGSITYVVVRVDPGRLLAPK